MKVNQNVLTKGDTDNFKRKQLFINICKSLGTNTVISLLLTLFLRIISNHSTYENNYSNYTYLAHFLGKSLLVKHHYYLYTKYLSGLKVSIKPFFSTWKSSQDNLEDINQADITTSLAFPLLELLISYGHLKKLTKLNFVLENGMKKVAYVTYIIPDDSVINMFETNKFYLPLHLPMIVPPKPYGTKVVNSKQIEILGGYLNNDEKLYDSIFTTRFKYKETSVIVTDDIYKAVNMMSSIPYKICNSVFEFITNNWRKYNLLLDLDEINNKHSYIEKDKRKFKSSYHENKYKSLLSQYRQEQNIMYIAYLYINVPKFYFPLRMDQRGRMYCTPNYLNYQSSDLSKALLCFSDAGSLSRTNFEGIEYLKIYGANCFGLDKESHTSRIKWIHDNKSNILNFENGILLNKAKDKLLFLSFCIEYKRFYDFYMNDIAMEFYTYLPLQLDATCNGFQHMALLSNEDTLFK